MTSENKLARRLRSLLFLFPFVVILAGCGSGPLTHSVSGRLTVTGMVHGGVQPVSGATVELYSVGTTGNGSQATNILRRPVITDAGSNFSISNDYTCSGPSQQVYLVVRGGNPGLAGNVNNPALVFLSALGNCTELLNNPSAFVYVNEVSTVAAVYALAPFMTSYDHVGASATNTVGLGNAFLNANLLANTANGQAAALAPNLAVEQGKLYALANAIVPCVNSNGNACSFLFSAATEPGSAAPTDTVGALINIVKHPGNHVADVFNLISPVPPFPGTLKKAPSDWTMSLTVTGGGLYQPTALAVDRSGNVWAANFGGSDPSKSGPNPMGVVAYSPQGIPFSNTPFAASVNASEVYGLTLDRNNNVWITSEENIAHGNTRGSVIKVAGADSTTPGAPLGTFYDNTLDFPESIAADPSTGNILIANYAGNSATVYDNQGNFLKNVAAGSAIYPISITSDGAGGLWTANEGWYTITHVAADGTAQSTSCCSEPRTVSLDPDGNVWVTNFVEVKGAYTITEVSPNGAVIFSEMPVAGLITPTRGAVDAGGQFWVLNYHDGTFLDIAGNHAATPVGTVLSPVALGRDAKLVEPFGLAADPSGNLWISNQVQNSLVMFFGVATPTATPSMARPVAP